MADQKVSDLPSLNGADVDAADLLYIIDSSAGSAGSKKITVGQYQLAPVSGGTANGVMYLDGSKVVTTGSALVFDGSNLGLGVTPSAWQADWNVYQASRDAAFGGVDGGAVYGFMSVNAYADGSASPSTATWRYQLTGSLASKYEQTSGEHRWFTAPSGTAGNAISFTQAMTLNAGGVLTLGSNIPALNVGSSAVSTGDCSIEIGAGRTGTGNAYIDLTGDTTYTDYGLRIIRNSGGANTASAIVHRGTGELQLSCSEAAAITFTTNATERARITSGGDLLVGATTLSAVGNSIFGSSVPGVIHQNNNAAANGFVFTSYRRSSVEIGSVSQNGTTAVLFNTTSDRRLKDNITPAPSASDVIDAIQIVSHDWKSAPDEHVTYGVIAQDLALVAPQAVLQGDDGDEIEKTWGVDYSKLVPMLIKEIQTLRARVAALESA